MKAKVLNRVITTALLGTLAAFVAGCNSESSVDISGAPADSYNDSEEVQIVDVAERAPAPAPAAAPAVDESQFNEQLPPVEAAQAKSAEQLETGDYVGAVDSLLRVQMNATAMTPQQRANQKQAMYDVQRRLAKAMDSGDPNAQRAAKLLMQYQAAQLR